MAHILVAEDERDIRELIQLTLQFAGYVVTTAANGEIAVETARTADPRFDLILSDVRMPKLTGFEACRQIRQLPGYESTPIVLLTAKGQDEEKEMGAAAGATAYIVKPLPDDFLQRIGRLVESR